MEPPFSGSSLPTPATDAKKRFVTYFYEPTIGDYSYGPDHFMVPRRISMTHSMVESYKLEQHMKVVKIHPAETNEMYMFHDKGYIDFLSEVTPTNIGQKDTEIVKKYIEKQDDCPVFDGLFEFCKLSVGGTLGCAAVLNRSEADIAINWAGGLHHAKKTKASGFCYVNDIVLGIQELLKIHQRVLYVDIDIHHGDGVEQAFYTTDRVMTISFHKYDGNFFPSTGEIKDTGEGNGKNYSLNVPLDDGMDDTSFCGLFRPVLSKVMEVYGPQVIVLQCGADSLAGDRLGTFDLSVKGHADCLNYLRSFQVPLMVLGGGGYTVNNVARCWCYETGVAVGVDLENQQPDAFSEDFEPYFTLDVKKRYHNKNTPGGMEKLKNLLLEQLSKLTHRPSIPFRTEERPLELPEEDDEEPMEERPNRRILSGLKKSKMGSSCNEG